MRPFVAVAHRDGAIGLLENQGLPPFLVQRRLASRRPLRAADLDLWAYKRSVRLDFSRPGKRTGNGFIEASNSRLRAECLNAHWFLSLADAREKLETWRRDYNDVRPHGANGYKVTSALHYPGGDASPSP